MKKKRYTEKDIIGAIEQHDSPFKGLASTELTDYKIISLR